MAELTTSLTTVGVVSALAGAAIGGLATYYVTKKKLDAYYTELINEEVESVKKSFGKLRKIGDFETPESAAETLLNEEPDEVVELVITEEIEIIEQAKEADALIQELGYDQEDDEGKHEIVTIRSNDRPYLISHEEYVEGMDGHDPLILRYYEGDDTLAGADDDIEVDGDAVGVEFSGKFGERSRDKDIVYVRNEKLGADFEIHRDLRTFAEAVYGIIPEKSEKNRKMRDSD